MSLHSTPERHDADPPSAWLVVKVAERCWHLDSSLGGTFGYYTTKRAAEADKIGGYYVNLYESDARWFAGENVHPRKPYAQVVAERERNEQWQAQVGAFKAAGYSRVPAYQMEEMGPGKLCCGGREELPADESAWQDSEGWLWCRTHLTSLLSSESVPS